MGCDDGLPPGVTGPITDPLDNFIKQTYHDREMAVLNRQEKSFLKPVQLAHTTIHLLFTKPAEIIHNVFDTISCKQSNRFYHQKFPRVKEIWECDQSDPTCVFEAEQQFKRDHMVDLEIVEILRERLDVCELRNEFSYDVKCKEINELFESASNSYHIKYGELGVKMNARNTLNKQKNRYIENRYLQRMLKRKVEE